MARKTRIYNKVFRIVVFTITILTANLLSELLTDYLVSFKNYYRPLIFSLMAMGIIVLIFYPAFQILDYWIKKMSTNVVKTGSTLSGKYSGLVLAFILSVAILSFFYIKMWYDINILDFLFMGKAKLLY
jgi:hypothetical protein